MIFPSKKNSVIKQIHNRKDPMVVEVEVEVEVKTLNSPFLF